MIPSQSMLMGRSKRQRNYLRRTLFAAGALGILAYFIASTVTGERGLFAAAEFKRANSVKAARLAQLQSDRDYLDRRVNALDPKHLDLDMLDEAARHVLSYSEEEEVLLKSGQPPIPPKP